MIESLDMHVLDLVQNSTSAGATKITVLVACDQVTDQLTLQVSDDGRGMDEDTMNAVRRGYFSSKSPKSVGLGIPLLREVAEHCDGSFDIKSGLGKGTTVTATFRRSHVDLPPFGDLVKTFLNILVTSGIRWVRITYRCDNREFLVDTNELHDVLGEVSLQHPEVIQFLQGYIEERMERNWEGT